MLTVPKYVALVAWSLYCLLIGVLFIVIKVVNFKLHKLFDTNEKIEAPNDASSSWTRAQSVSPTSIEQIELQEFSNSAGLRASQTSPTDDLEPKTNVTVVVDVERNGAGDVGAAGEDGGKGVKSLEDITSMEDIVSLEALQLDQLKTNAASDKNDRVRSFRRTVKAMSTQVTPQTSPLIGHKRRAISQERWPSSVTSITTPPPTLRRHQIQYHSQRVTRGHNITYRRRSKSVLDSPHGSHMLIGESRTEERPPLTLEWAGHPHPSPRPRHRHRHRQMSLEEPLSGSAARRYSLDLKPCRGRSRDRLGTATQSSNILVRTESEKSEDLKALRDTLLIRSHKRKISTVSEPCDPFGESGSSDDSSSNRKQSNKILTKPQSVSSSGVELRTEPTLPIGCGHIPENDVVNASSGSTSLPASKACISEQEELVKSAESGVSKDNDVTDTLNESNNNNDSDTSCNAKQSSNSATSCSTASSYLPSHSETAEPVTCLSVVQEMLELESPRSPIADPPLSAARSADAGAIPKVSKQSSTKPSRHLSDSENIALVSGEDTQSSPSSSVSGCERQALLVTALSKAESSENTPPLYNSNEGPIRPRRSVHRFTSLGSSEHRNSVRRARYYGSHSSWGSRRSSRSRRHSDSEHPVFTAQNEGRAEEPPTEQWHFFKDTDGKSCPVNLDVLLW
ncbi:hypothetical protein EB796_012459 [Bugula neritina]|uniref:Uncharacterized protein n=1 Tax=Bugula neritina TaxID=10212 RepID=A0A7J7JSA8_BUGNE|nr:hypothetical protein EB796_012459 [Bugula neritina]